MEVANPYETYSPEEVTVVECHECQRDVNPDECCEIGGNYYCERCIDPTAKGFDRLISAIAMYEAQIAGLKMDNRSLRNEITVLKMDPRRRAA